MVKPLLIGMTVIAAMVPCTAGAGTTAKVASEKKVEQDRFQRRDLESLDTLRRTRDEMAELLVKFDEDVESYRKAVIGYNARLGGCEGMKFTDADRRQAGCSGKSDGDCSKKLVAACMGDAATGVDAALRRAREGAANVKSVAAAVEDSAAKLQ